MSDKNTDRIRTTGQINRRNVLKGLSAAGAVGVLGSGQAAARGRGRGPDGDGPPGQSCDCDDFEGEFIAKYDFECIDEDDGECIEWGFVLMEGQDVVDITVTEVKEGDDSEPITVEFEADGFIVQSVCAYGGRDTDNVEDEEGVTEFATDLTNPGGQQAAISNLTFCGTDDPDPDPELEIVVEQDADSASADGESSIELTATVTHDGDPLEGAEVSVEDDGEDIIYDPTDQTQETDSDGQAVWNVSSNVVQNDVEFTFTVEDEFGQEATDTATKDFTPVCAELTAEFDCVTWDPEEEEPGTGETSPTGHRITVENINAGDTEYGLAILNSPDEFVAIDGRFIEGNSTQTVFGRDASFPLAGLIFWEDDDECEDFKGLTRAGDWEGFEEDEVVGVDPNVFVWGTAPPTRSDYEEVLELENIDDFNERLDPPGDGTIPEDAFVAVIDYSGLDPEEEWDADPGEWPDYACD